MKRKKDRSLLSQDPHAIRQRIRHKNNDMTEDIDLLYKKPVSEWDLEELARGRPRAKNGTFQGGKPRWVSPKIAEEAKRRLKEETMGQLSEHVGFALRVVKDLMTNTDLGEDGYPIVDNRLKLDAAKFVVEHVIGKPRQRVDVEAGDTLQEMLANVLVNPDGSPAHPIIEGEVLAYGDEDPDEAD